MGKQWTPVQRLLANRVRAIRTQQGLSQSALAARTGTSRSQIAAVERGERSPTITTVHNLARALQVPITVLIDDTRQPKLPDRACRLAESMRRRGEDYLEAFEKILSVIDGLVTESLQQGKNDVPPPV